MRWLYMLMICLLPVAGMGQSLDLNGSDEYISLAVISGLGSGNCTFSVWIKTTDTGQNSVVIEQNEGDNNPFIRLITTSVGDRIYLQTYDGSYKTVASTTDVVDGTWHHVCGTKEGTTGKIYVDGILEDTDTISNVSISTGFLSIGVQWRSTGSEHYFDGAIAGVGIWTRALSAAEIGSMYAQRSRFIPRDNLVGYWDMYVRGTEQGVALTSGTIPDLSGNGNTGTIVNGATPSEAITRKPRRR